MTPGVLPRSWRWVKLSEIAAPVPNAIVDGPFGSNLKLADYVDKGVPVLQGKNVTNDSFRWLDVRFVSERKAAELKRSSVRVGDILIVKIGSIGYSAIVDDLMGFDCAIIPANLAKVTPDDAKVDLRYLHKWLTSVDAKRYLVGAASTTAQPALSLGKIRSLPVPLPPIAEQRRIAGLLDRAEALRAQRLAVLTKLDGLTQSIFDEMFGDPATNPKGWRAVLLGDVLTMIRNGANLEQRLEPGGWPITRIETISAGVVNPERVRWVEPDASLLSDFQLQPGDILFGHINSVEQIGKTALYSGYPAPLIHGINLLRLQPNLHLVDPVWLLHMLKHKVVRTYFRIRCKRAVNQASLNQQDIKGLAIPLPPIPLQRLFASRLSTVERASVVNRASLAELDALFASLQHRAFRGEL